MGCCMSSESKRSSHSSASSPTRNNKGSTHPPRSSISRAKDTESRAPPPLIEEETVKEVLSETPKWKPKVSKFEAQQEILTQKPKSFGKFQREKKKNYEEDDAFTMATTINNKGEEISEVSEEVCSFSESVSTTTFTEEETRQRVNRSPARMQKNRSFSGDFASRTVGKSPARRSEQSPARRNGGSVRVVRSRDQMGNGVTRNQPRRRDVGENSGRRSRSPATRTDNGATRSVVGRSPSARRGTSQSPARVRTAAPAPESSGRKMENPAMEEGKWPSAANESLENPLVSLECFIFL